MEGYRHTGRAVDMLTVFPEYRMMRDSVTRKDKIRQLASANIRFETQKKEQENRLLTAEVRIQETMNPGMKVKHIKYTNISLNAGYAYNWVFARNCLACLSFNPAVAYKTSRIEKTEEREADDWYKNFNIDFILRAGVVYNNSKYFVGTSFVGRTYDYYKNSFSLNNGFGTLQIYAGFNFYLKKEYRKNKK